MRVTLLLCLLAGCSRPEPPPPPVPEIPVEARFAGCAEMRSGPLCILGPERKLTIWVRHVPGVAFEVRASGQVLTAITADVEGGRRFELTIPEGASEVKVVPRGARGRWKLAFGVADPLPVIEEARALRRTKPAVATALLEKALPKLAPERRGEALGLLGRLAHDQGQAEVAFVRLREAIAANKAHGRVSLAFNDGIALSYFLAHSALRLAEARKVMESELEPLAATFDEGAAGLPYYQALVAEKAGDLRTALRRLREAARATAAVGLHSVRRYSLQILAVDLQLVGQADEAAATVKLLRQEMARVTDSCERARVLDNIAWVRLLHCEAAAGDACARLLDPARTSLELCPGQGIAQANLAHAHLLGGEPALALEAVQAARKSARLEDHTRVWLDDLEARVRLAQGADAAAVALYRGLERRGIEGRTPDVVWRAVLGQGHAHLRAGRLEQSVDAFARAEVLLDDLAVALPLHQGRETFLADRTRATRDQLDVLLRLGRPEAAFAVARRARSRVVRHLQRFDRLGKLSAEERDRWDAAISAYRRGRKAAKPEAARLRALLDDAFAVLAEAPVRRGLRAPARGELWLAYHPLPEGWAAFGATAGQVVAHRLGDVDPKASAEVLSERLLWPFAEQLATAERLRILPYGVLRDLDFHALPWQGAPLVAALPVAYPLDLPERPPVAAGRRRAVVVADPLGDLPGALNEARAVRAALEAQRWSVLTLRGSKASGASLRASLWDASVLHYAGHGVFAGRGGWDSALRLADRRLTVGDILALPRVPPRVVLSGCETARTGRDAPLASVGLANAFLAGGAEEVVAAVRPVDDAMTTQLVASLYAGAPDEPVEVGLRRAQLALLSASGVVPSRRLRGVGAVPVSKDADWAAFRALLR